MMEFKHIPGLPHTEEERNEAILRAEDDIKNGRVYTHEEVVVRMNRLFEEPICNLPYTVEERKADFIAAEKEIAAGNVIAWEDLKKEMETW